MEACCRLSLLEVRVIQIPDAEGHFAHERLRGQLRPAATGAWGAPDENGSCSHTADFAEGGRFAHLLSSQPWGLVGLSEG